MSDKTRRQIGEDMIRDVYAGDVVVPPQGYAFTDVMLEQLFAELWTRDTLSMRDKRILLIDGEPVPHRLARIPSDEDNRGNMVAGAAAVGQPMSRRDFEICEAVGPALRDAGVLFAGIDVIGDYLTEVNVTSPTGIRELDRQFNLNIGGLMFDAIEKKLA